jgi:hypothetical protein
MAERRGDHRRDADGAERGAEVFAEAQRRV